MFSISMTNDEDRSWESYAFKTDDQSRIFSSKSVGSKKFNLELSAREAVIVNSITGLWLYKHFGEGSDDLLDEETEDRIEKIFQRIINGETA